MKIGQIRWKNDVAAALVLNGQARPVPGYTVVDLIRRSEVEAVPLTKVVGELASAHPEPFQPVIPIRPREVWGCGGTYAPLAVPARPEIFLKGTERVCVGPGQPIGIRSDSRFTIPEPELALVLGSKGRIVGFTLANDVVACDIARENPLYLAQSKIYAGCCALGPVIVTPDELTDPYRLELTCTVRRGDRTLFSGSVSTSKLNRRLEVLLDYLMRSNPVPLGSVLLTGAGMSLGEEAALVPGDIVTISNPEIGELSNPAAGV